MYVCMYVCMYEFQPCSFVQLANDVAYVCLYVCMYTCMYEFQPYSFVQLANDVAYVCLYVCMYIHVCMNSNHALLSSLQMMMHILYVCMYMCTCSEMWTKLCVYILMRSCMCACVCVCVYVCMHMFICSKMCTKSCAYIHWDWCIHVYIIHMYTQPSSTCWVPKRLKNVQKKERNRWDRPSRYFFIGNTELCVRWVERRKKEIAETDLLATFSSVIPNRVWGEWNAELRVAPRLLTTSLMKQLQ